VSVLQGGMRGAPANLVGSFTTSSSASCVSQNTDTRQGWQGAEQTKGRPIFSQSLKHTQFSVI